MGYYNYYRHLDKDPVSAPFNMDQIAEWAANQNYGTHRLVCALIRAAYKRFPDSELAKALEDVVEKFTT